MERVHPGFPQHCTDPLAEEKALEDRPEGWLPCGALGYSIHPDVCTQRKRSHQEEPHRNLCSARCPYLAPQPFSSAEPLPFRSKAPMKKEIQTYRCVGLPSEPCWEQVTRNGGRCARHGQLWRYLQRQLSQRVG